MNSLEEKESRVTFQAGAKSFSLAALFFDRQMYAGACQVYAWCRASDDAIDEVAQERQLLEQRVAALQEESQKVFEGDTNISPAFREFQRVVERCRIPRIFAFDLIEGLAMDARKERYETLEDLELYAYRVAGTVGLMMSHVMGVKSDKAFYHAKQLGIAMQLTNIARDVIEDARMGRIYLPLSWLRDEGVAPNEILNPEKRGQVARVAKRLVCAAEHYYGEGEAGLRYLHFRPALAIAAASRIYRAIGLYVVKREARAWDTRTVVPRWRKYWELALSPLRVWRMA